MVKGKNNKLSVINCLLIGASMLFAAKLEAQEATLLGKVECGDEAVDFAYFLNTRTQKTAKSNDGGLFKIEVQNGDTLKFRCLGYNESLFVVSNEPQTLQVFRVTKQTYSLDEVTVHGFYSYAAFKQAFLNLKLDEKDKPFKYHVNLDMNELAVDAKMASGGTGLSIPLTSLNGVGLAGKTKDERQAMELSRQEKAMERYNRLISHENIGDFTRLNGQALDSFIVYLRTRANINPALNDYDMMMAVKLAFLTYAHDKKIDIDNSLIR
ncbi:MAG: hypothetical protein QM786_18360 [Breznakibacter sp.]